MNDYPTIGKVKSVDTSTIFTKGKKKGVVESHFSYLKPKQVSVKKSGKWISKVKHFNNEY